MKWHPYSRLRLSETDTALEPWLNDPGSLTRRLIQLSQGAFRVEVLCQQWGRARRDEALVLGQPFRHRCIIREVLLYGHNTPWVYARSILPASSLQGSLGFLKNLGNKPLGALLFNNPTMRRSEIEIASFTAAELPVSLKGKAWGRRSVFYVSNKPLLVSEIFLPAFLAALNPSMIKH